ncbi:MAG: MFS transporter [Thermoleophilia bacterium]
MDAVGATGEQAAVGRGRVLRWLLAAALATAVSVAFADSSIVVLALPDLYVAFRTSIQGIAWVITGYNVVVAVVAIALVPLVSRVSLVWLTRAGIVLFLGASIGCALAGDLTTLIAVRLVQGLGAALFLAGSLPLLGSLLGSRGRGTATWLLAGTLGAALGPALGGVLTELFDWRAIFVAQAPVAGLALLGTLGAHGASLAGERHEGRLRETGWGNLGLFFVFGALVGALFLGVVLVITVWGYSPIAGAGIVSALPAATILVRPIASRLWPAACAAGGAVLLAAGLAALALLPAASPVYAALALALCGAGLGLAVPPFSASATTERAGLVRSATFSIGVRHLGLVLALALLAPLLSHDLDAAGQRASLTATAVVLDGELPLTKKIPLALDMRGLFDAAQQGEVPDLDAPFEAQGAATDERVAQVRDDLTGTIEASITRGFRWSFLVSALLALLAAPVALGLLRRREER